MSFEKSSIHMVSFMHDSSSLRSQATQQRFTLSSLSLCISPWLAACPSLSVEKTMSEWCASSELSFYSGINEIRGTLESALRLTMSNTPLCEPAIQLHSSDLDLTFPTSLTVHD